MSSSLFSASWYRTGILRPQLRRQAHLVRHSYRGERWHVLQDQASGRFLRLDDTAYRFVALMDGARTVDNIWQQLCGELGDDAPTQDDVLGLLAQLHQANVLLITDRQPDVEELDERRRRSLKMRLKQYIGNPLSLKMPLLDPDRFLTAVVGLFPRGMGKWLLMAWLVLVGSGVAVAVMNWQALTSDITSRVFTAENMLLLWLAFPVLKGIHELGHGLAIKAFGGTCRELGLMFLMLVPVPYVDATAVTAFPDKRRRMIVGLAGMAIELAVAAMAIWLWSWSSPGVGKALLHQVVILASITTVLFNINPLLRFDGYYVLADWLEIPNLGTKANRYVGYLLQRDLFKIRRGLSAPRLTPGEAPWLLGYAVTSFAYRMFVAVLIVLTVAQQFFFVGVLMALWASWTMLLKPLSDQVRFLVSAPVLEGRRRRAITMTVGFTTVVVAMLTLVPVSSWTMTEGVIWMPEQARLRAPLPCFGREVLVKPGAQVKAGTPLLQCDDPELEARLRQAQARAQELEARLALAVTADRVQLGMVQTELDYYRAQLADLAQRRAALIIRSTQSGTFAMEAPSDFAGKYLERGTVLAYVLDPRAYSLLTTVPQGEVDLVRNRTQEVELRVPGQMQELIPARIVREVPAATRELPSLALALQGGGQIGLDPDSQGAGSPRALTPLFQFEVRFTGQHLPRALGSRVHVRFVQSPEPLASQWYRQVRQAFLKRFSV
jgi:putative peptide zinc metalloprotease protein